MRSNLLHAALLALLLAPTALLAHDLSMTRARVVFNVDGTYTAEVILDLDALALGAPRGADSAELAERLANLAPDELERVMARLHRTVATRVRLRFDGQPARPEVTFPGEATGDIPSFLGLTTRLHGQIPPGAETFTLRLSRSLPQAHLLILDERRDLRISELLELATPSAPFPLIGEPPPALTQRSVVQQYLVLGFEHILPKGLDHILFVLGLFLLAARFKPLLWQISAFTLAHTVTLALATLGIVTLPSHIVEPLIALSIAWVAVENVLTDELHAWRPWVVFGFGLLHGLGFAGVLGELGLPEDELVTALVAFNVGVELGQLAVIGVALLAFGVWREKPWYRRRVVVPLSLLIAVVGLWWAIERTFLS